MRAVRTYVKKTVLVAAICGAMAVPAAKAEDIQQVISMLQLGAIPEGVNTLNTYARKQSENPLAQQMHNDLLRARFGVQPRLKVSEHTQAAAKDSLDSMKTGALIAESRMRLFHHFNPPPTDMVPSGVLQMSSDQPYIIVVDQSKSRVHVYQNMGDNKVQQVANYYTSIGSAGAGKQYEGDMRTPVGVYFITRKKTDAELEELYGISAFPVNYPNSWDISQKRTGSGIWLHGVPRTTYTRAPLASRGCVVMANEHMVDIEQYIRVGKTPVVLAERIIWKKAEDAKKERDAFKATHDLWLADWQSLNTKAYLSHYSDKFRAQKMNKRSWSALKKRVNANKKFIKVTLSNHSIYRMPTEPVVVTTFTQKYESDNHKSVATKRQYWHFGASGWKIIFEDTLGW